MSSFEITKEGNDPPKTLSNNYGRKIAARIEERLNEHRAISEPKPNNAGQDLVGLLSEVSSTSVDNSGETGSRIRMLFKKYASHGALVLVILVLLALYISATLQSSQALTQVNDLESDLLSLKNELAAMKAAPQAVVLEKSPQGGVTAVINADSFQFLSQPKQFEVKESTLNNKRVWSPSALKICVGDQVHWKWEHNENVVSCTSTGQGVSLSQRILHSGDLTVGGSFNFTFYSPGTYYYNSQNSQTLTGVIIVQDTQYYSDRRHLYTGPVQASPLSSGIQQNISVRDLYTLDGCWEVCYSAPIKTLPSIPPFYNCEGDWMFVGVSTTKMPGRFLQGAFVKSQVISSPLFQNLYQYSNCYPYQNLNAVPGGGAYWYNFQCFSNNAQYFTYGFKSQSSVSLSPSNNYLDCQTGGVSIGSNGICIDGTYSTDSSLYRVVFYTNTCPLGLP